MGETALTPEASDGAGKAAGSLKQRAARGAAWTLGSHGSVAAIKLASNLILTRLLFPEAFGLIALAGLAVMAVEMCSDIGLRGSVVSNPRAGERRFLATVFSVQVFRGLTLTVLVALAAPLIAAALDQPLLSLLIPVTGLRLAINGFASTSLLTLLRRVELGRREILVVGSQAFAVIAMIALAVVFESVWVLVVGDLTLALVRTVGSHFLVPGERDRFAWDRGAARDLLRFGRWIWVSTMMTFLLSQGDRVVLGTIMSAAELGVYSIAFALCVMVVGSAQQLAGNLLFPVYSELAREGGAGGLRRIRRARGLAMAAFVPPLCGFVVAGPIIVDVLYDERYRDAGWMLQIIAAGAIPQVLVVSAERGLLAFGDSFRHMALQIASALLFVAGLLAGAMWGGSVGLMIGGSVARLLAYVPFALLSRKYGFGTPGLDLLALGAAALLCAGGIAALDGLP